MGGRTLQEMAYEFTAVVKWDSEFTEDGLREKLIGLKNIEARKMITSFSPFKLSQRLWEFLLIRAGVNLQFKWADLPKKEMNKLIEELLRGEYRVKGKTTFKEEFVTCGGIKLSEVDFKTMESKVCDSLYFAGEVLDIDGVTGGFNFQNAWTTGWIAAKAISTKLSNKE